MRSNEDEGGADIVARAAAVASRADLATLLRDLRRREARLRRGRALTYRQIAEQNGWGIGSVCEYFSGGALAPDDRFDELLRVLAARPAEIGALATARERLTVASAADRPEPSVVAPRALPAAAHGFTGRTAQLAQLDRALADWTGSGPVVISAVAGMGGVGKTALAVHWAHRVRERFPDGQLHVNLRGYDPSEPLPTVDALGLLLTDLGIEPDDLPGDLDGRLARYRELLAQRRALVVLDNAGGVEQVRPLLPPPSCLALVTSRDDLTELATVDGATVLRLDVFELDEAIALLRVLIGSRADREPEAVRALALRCGRLPLALRVAAEHVAFRQHVAIADLVTELDNDGEPLDALSTTGEARSDVRGVFSWSLRRLPASAGRVLRLLGLWPGVDIDRFALAALAGIDVDGLDQITRVLRQAHLLQADAHGRFSMHDLLRAYAAELAAQELTDEEREVAKTRLLDYYLAVAASASGLLFPQFRANGGPQPGWPAAAPRVDDVASASAWLTTEWANLVRVSLHAAAHGRTAYAVTFAVTIWRSLSDGHDEDSLAVQTAALAAADQAADDCDAVDRAMVRLQAGNTNWRVGRFDVAAELVEQALDEFTRLGHAVGMSRSVGVLGAIRDAQGRYAEAVQCQVRGLELARSGGLTVQEGRHLINLAFAHLRMEQYEAAADACRAAIAVIEPTGDALMLAEPRYYLAIVHVELGRDLDEAIALAEEVIAVTVEHRRTTMTAMAIHAIGYAYLRMGDLRRGRDILSDVLAMARRLESPSALAELLNAYGEACRRTGDHARAIECHHEARDLSASSDDKHEVARSEEFLGEAYAAAGQSEAAQEHRRTALRQYTELGIATAVRRLGERLAAPS